MEIKNYIKKRIDGLVYVDYEQLTVDLMEKVNELEAQLENLDKGVATLQTKIEKPFDYEGGIVI